MSDQEKDNKEFEFIKEQVVERKRRKIKKWFLPPLLTLLLAILFGLVASVTIVIAEPRLKKLFVDEDTRKPVYFPDDNAPGNLSPTVKATASITPTPSATPVVIENSIPADIDDYISMNNDIKEVASSVSKSILNIRSKITTDVVWFDKPVVKTVNTTGVIVFNNDEELLVLVSLDKVKGSDNIKVIFTDSITVDATLQDYETDLNLAIIAVPIKDIPLTFMNGLDQAKLGESYSIVVGSPIIALGSPNGHAGSMEIGMITSKGSCACLTDNEMDLFNTDIIDNKNSDGVIVDFKGQVIGIITQELKEKDYENLSTVIGISKLKPIITAMGNKAPRIYCGIKADDLTSDTKVQYGVGNGIYVKDVVADSPAFKAGMQNGDIILEVNGSSILGVTNFYQKISSYKPGEKVKVEVLRSIKGVDTKLTLSVTLVQKKK